MIQGAKAQGWEVWLAPASIEWHPAGGSKPPFPTLSFLP